MRRLIHLTFLAGFLLAGCGASAPPASEPGFVFVTVAPNASPTPTPFQPIPWTPIGTSPLAGEPAPVVDTVTPAATLPPPTQTLPPTIDPSLLINTVVPFSTIVPSGSDSQILSNGQETVNFLLIGSDKRPG